MENVVLDTNCLVSSLKRSSIYFPIWRDFILGKYCLCFTDDILHEYQEIIEKLTGSPMIARNVIAAILTEIIFFMSKYFIISNLSLQIKMTINLLIVL